MEEDEPAPANAQYLLSSPMIVENMDTGEASISEGDVYEPLIPPDSPSAPEPLVDPEYRRRPPVDLRFPPPAAPPAQQPDGPEIVPEVKIRKILSENKESFHSVDGHGEYFNASLGESKFTGVFRKLESYPTGSVIIYTIQFNNEETWFNIGELPNLTYNNSSLLAYFFSILSNDFPNGGVFGLQSTSETLVIEAKKISRMVSTSDAVRFSQPYSERDLLDYCINWLTYLGGRTGEGDPYQGFYILNENSYRVSSLSVILIPQWPAGGCNIGVSAPAGPLAACLFLSNAENNNCFFDAIKQCADVSGIILDSDLIPNNDLIWDSLRAVLNIPVGYPIYYRDDFNKKTNMPGDEHLKRICGFFEINLDIYSIEDIRKRKGDWGRHIVLVKQYRRTHKPERSNDLMYVKKADFIASIFYQQRGRFGHFYAIRDLDIVKFKACIKCSNWLDSNNEDLCTSHFIRCIRCPICSCHMGDNHMETCRGNTRPNANSVPKVMRVKNRAPKETWNKNVYFADFETFQDGDRQVVYSAALVSIDALIDFDSTGYQLDKSQVHCSKYYAKFESFCTEVAEMTGSCWFWFGSMFDFLFLVNYYVAHKYQIHDFLKHDGTSKILTFRVGKMVFKDLYLFTMCSLHEGCRSFGVPAAYVKKDFDHSLIKSWDDVKQHENVVIDYNQYDVICMGIIYIIFARELWDLWQYNLNSAITLSHAAHEIWSKMLPEEVKKSLILPEKDVYHFIHRALFGGRTMPFYPLWQSQFTKTPAYENWDNLTDDLKRQYMEYVDEYSNPPLYIDANSLYPSVCVRYAYPYGRYKWYSTESNFTDYWSVFGSIASYDIRKQSIRSVYNYQHTNAYRKLLKSFVEVDIQCPKDLLIPFLFHRDENGNSVQNLEDKVQQVYDGATLEEAIILGYRVTRIYRVLRYPKYDKILSQYMEKFHELKQQAEANGQDAKRAINKGFLNNLTGKFSQKYNHRKADFIYDDTKFNDSKYVSTIQKMEFIVVDKKVDRFLVFTQDQDDVAPSKLKQLGACILAWSRIWMSQITRSLGNKPGGAYLNPEFMPFYTDTDSLIVPRRAVDMMTPTAKEMYIGNKLGQMKPEINGVIINFVALAPKTYYYTYIDAKDLKLYGGVRTKGIPHNPQWSFRGKVDLFKVKTAPLKAINEDLRDVFYSLCERGEKHKGKVQKGIVLDTKNYIPFEYLERCYKEDLVVVATFGRLNRALISKDTDNNVGVVKLDLGSHRTINQTNWWQSGKRKMLIYHSVPKGHILFDS